MAVPVSENLEKCKQKNLIEHNRCQEKLRQLMVTERTAIHQLDRERLALLQQLQINRCKVLRSSMREDMLLTDRLSLLKRDMKLSNRSKTTLFERSKGFSKIQIEDDDNNDKAIFHSIRRAKTNFSMYYDNDKPPPFALTENDIFVLYPTGENKKNGKVIVSVADLRNNRKCADLFPNVPNKRPHTVCGTSRSKYPMPTYVTKLEKLSKQNFDQYTDGTMHLEERRFHQRQREYLPPQSGHLPVRRRFFSASSNNFRLVLEDNNLTSLPPKNIKIYLPKSIRDERDAEDKNEQRRIMRIKQENEANQYANVIALTAGFLGKEPLSKNMIKKPGLSKEEVIMFSHVKKKLPSFKVAATVVKWLTASFRKSSAKVRDRSSLKQRSSVTFSDDIVKDNQPYDYQSVSVMDDTYTVSEICGNDHESF